MDAAAAPLVFVEASSEAFRAAVEDLLEAGWPVRDGFDAARGVVVLAGVVADGSDAARALGAVLAGAGVVVHALADRATLDRLYDDLRRHGPVDVRGREAEPLLDAVQRRLLRLLAHGDTVASAARALNMSRRTVDRRLAAARDAIGVRTTAEAISASRSTVAPPTPPSR